MLNEIRVGITHGDYNGVGYEVIFKALADAEIADLMTPVVFGNADLAAQTIKSCMLEGVHFTVVKSAADAKPGRINIVEVCDKKPQPTLGTPSAEGGEAALTALEYATKALKDGEIDVLVTAPIDKNSIHSDNFPFSGHTEYLQDRFGNEGDALMVLFSDEIRIALATVHEPISKVAELITRERVSQTIRKFNATLKRDFGCDGPLIAVLGLNPHCGDGGLIGNEEQTAIIPAIKECREENIHVFGPFAADGFFAAGSYRKFDGVIAMYHDQGLAPFKALAGQSGVNFTAGLEIVRTSPDHGTAYDIAGKQLADGRSMREALYRSIDILKARRRYDEASENPLEITPKNHKNTKQ
ncbi:MAG: 4-hydroxythreonine-4-phosphate dehydrogenase PdxA [Clostridium sp.]|nr:4-hydroxythreonine-4-phosphate dehydrogenase PdxA [Prevotella sp.]MCM1428409.1 4-hydroxythreonine-4-phosphate dehydrogenase PdxA [Clostridium sp.]MCM1476260.1 4-hydroxythreonine-4-phosphate dehydrogenase PdxA [Muribaculaceae bacterium]